MTAPITKERIEEIDRFYNGPNRGECVVIPNAQDVRDLLSALNEATTRADAAERDCKCEMEARYEQARIAKECRARAERAEANERARHAAVPKAFMAAQATEGATAVVSVSPETWNALQATLAVDRTRADAAEACLVGLREAAISLRLASVGVTHHHKNCACPERGGEPGNACDCGFAETTALDLALTNTTALASQTRQRIRREAIEEVAVMVEAYRDAHPKASDDRRPGTPAEREHAAYLRGTRAGERSALYSVLCRLRPGSDSPLRSLADEEPSG